MAAVAAKAATSGSSGTSYNFAFTPFLEREYAFELAPAQTCPAFVQQACPNGGVGAPCPAGVHRQPTNYSNLICKHWLRGLCKKGSTCEFLHEYNLRQMPECSSWAKSGACVNGNECLYQHVDPFYKGEGCRWYERGFCPLGPHCAARHIKRKTFCKYWMAGFCPDGEFEGDGKGGVIAKGCMQGGHPKWVEQQELPKPQVRIILSEEEKEREAEMRRIKLEEELEARDRMHGITDDDQGGRGGRGRGRGRGRARGRGFRKREY